MMKSIHEAPVRPLVLAKRFTASSFELGKDLFGKYSSADDSGSSKHREHRAAGLSVKYERSQQQTSPITRA